MGNCKSITLLTKKYNICFKTVNLHYSYFVNKIKVVFRVSTGLCKPPSVNSRPSVLGLQWSALLFSQRSPRFAQAYANTINFFHFLNENAPLLLLIFLRPLIKRFSHGGEDWATPRQKFSRFWRIADAHAQC